MSYLQELLDFVEARNGDVESVRKSVFDSAVALDFSVEGIANSILLCMRSGGRGDRSVTQEKEEKEDERD
jgi:hypothetical protein